MWPLNTTLTVIQTRRDLSVTMSDSQAPRRSQREKKYVKPFASGIRATLLHKKSLIDNLTVDSAAGQGKRKRNDSDAEDNAPDASEPADAQPPLEGDGEDADEEEEEYHGPKLKATSAARKGKGRASPKRKGPPPAKKIKITKVPGPKPAKPTRKSRKHKDGDDSFDAAQVAKDTKMTADNPLFSAICLFCVILCISELVYSRHCHESICGVAVNGGGLFGVPRSYSRPCTSRVNQSHFTRLRLQRLCRR
jgi:hypothetical protein